MVGYYWLAAASSVTSVRQIRPIQSEGRAALAARPSAHRCDMTRPVRATMTRADRSLHTQLSEPRSRCAVPRRLQRMGGDVPVLHVLFSRGAAIGSTRSRFWFLESLHVPEPLYPFDAMTFDARRSRPQPGELAHLRRPALARRRVPHPQRVRLRQRQLHHRRSRRSRRAELVRASRRLLLRATGTSSTRAGVEKVEQATRRATTRSTVPELPEVEDESLVFGGEGARARRTICS